MKHTLSLLLVCTMLLSFASISVSAAQAPSDGMLRSRTPDGNETVPQKISAASADGKPADPMAAASLNEALNVPGGTLEFITQAMEGFLFKWVVEDDHAKSSNEGIDGDPSLYGATQSQVAAYVTLEQNQAIRFRYKVSCQNAENTDFFALFVDDLPVKIWYGEVDWDTYTVAIPEGTHVLEWVYNKDTSVSEGEDAAYLDDVEVIPYTHYTMVHSEELDAALNVPDGALEFSTPAEAANGYYPWVAEEG